MADVASATNDPAVADPTTFDDDAEVDDFSLSLAKKKKKKKTKKTESADGDNAVAVPTAVTAAAAGTSSAAGTNGVSGVAASDDSERDYNYSELLERVFHLLHEKNPNLTIRKRYTLAPPQLVRVGTRKTMWANFAVITATMHRQPEHIMSFLLAELGTEGSIDGNQRLVIKGRYQQKQVESLLKKYIMEYVTCHMCRNPETTLTRDSVTRLYFIECEACGSRRSVAPIKSGFHATMRAERRKTKDV